MGKDFYVYMMASQKNGTLYKGMTSNLIQRVWQHKNKIGSEFTSKHNVNQLVWYERCGRWEDAVAWEKRLRRYSREWKVNLIKEKNPNWNDLYVEITGQVDCTDRPCNDVVKIRDISKKLKSSLEARILLKHITGLSDADLIGHDDIVLNADQKILLDDFMAQRLKGRPISKIIGYKEFYGRDFIVNDDVLDPRPDSETLIEAVLETANKEKKIRILELGVGSGCLVLTLLSELPNAVAVGADISPQALNIAKQNAKELNVENRITFVESNWFQNIEGEFDLIISNPPYINSDVVTGLDKNVREFDPMLALDGGADGLDPYKVILPQLEKYLVTGGMVALEHGYDQCGRIEQMLMGEGLSQIRSYKDLGGLDRVLTAIHK